MQTLVLILKLALGHYVLKDFMSDTTFFLRKKMIIYLIFAD